MAALARLRIGASLRRCSSRTNFNIIIPRLTFTTTSARYDMSRRAWLNPDGPTGRPIGIVNPTNAPETGKEIWVQETPLPIATLSRFVEFLGNHKLPNGQTTTIPTLSSDDFSKIMRPYNDWASAPYNTNSIRSDSAMNRFSMSFTGLPDLLDFEALLSSGGFTVPPMIDFELEICRQRLWAGMVPLSDRRWAEKKLDAPENIDLAAEYILKTCDMMYFSLPATSRRMRQAYNKSYDIFAHFDTVLEAYYASNPSIPRPSPLARVADLWAEFFFSHVHFVTNRVHTWAASHLDRLANALLARMLSAPTLPGGMGMSPQQEAPFSQFQNFGHSIRRIDETILFPLVGFKNTLPHWRHAASPPIVDWPAYIRSHGATPLVPGTFPADVLQRNEVYHQRMANLVRQELTRLRNNPATPPGTSPFSPEEVAGPARAVLVAYAQGRRELRGEAEPVREELWVAALRQLLEGSGREGAAQPPRFVKWGFVAYRVWHGHSEEEWGKFVERFDADVKNWGEGVAGAEGVKGKLEIRWVDGREHGIAEGDVEGARKHFEKLHENGGAGLEGLDAPAFLVADQSSIDSYLHDVGLPEQRFVDEADMSPFIVVGAKDTVDAGAGRGGQAGFDGTVRVLGSVLLDDVWPCLWLRHVQVKDMWNLAALHPSGVYVGPVVQSQVEGWSHFRGMKEDLWKKAEEWRRQGRL